MRSRAAWSAGLPRISIVPESGPRMSITIRSVVVLPAPFGPSRPKMLLRGTSRERSATATWPAKALQMPLSTNAFSFTEPPAEILYSRPHVSSDEERSARTGAHRGEYRGLWRAADPRQGRLRRGSAAARAARLALPDRVRMPRAPRARADAAAARAPAALGDRLDLRRQLGGVLFCARDAAGLRDGARRLQLPGRGRSARGALRRRGADAALAGRGAHGLPGLRAHRGRTGRRRGLAGEGDRVGVRLRRRLRDLR